MRTMLKLLPVLLCGVVCSAQEVIRPVVAKSFGAPCVVKAEFVAKDNSYYDQNMVSEPYTLKVTTVDGRPLKTAVLIAYRLEAKPSDAKKIRRTGVVLELEAYETLVQPINATPWLADPETRLVKQGTAFSLEHVLHIRPLKKNPGESETK